MDCYNVVLTYEANNGDVVFKSFELNVLDGVEPTSSSVITFLSLENQVKKVLDFKISKQPHEMFVGIGKELGILHENLDDITRKTSFLVERVLGVMAKRDLAENQNHSIPYLLARHDNVILRVLKIMADSLCQSPEYLKLDWPNIVFDEEKDKEK